MKKWVTFLFICCLANSFSQINISPQFSELKGMEDQQGNTHLFYRIYTHTENFPIYSFTYNDIYHLDLNSLSDTLFLRDYRESNPVMFNALSVNDYKFWNNNPNEFIYVGMIGGQDPVPFINRFDQPNNLLNYFCCEVKNVDISEINDSLIYCGAWLFYPYDANAILSLDGGFSWLPVSDTLTFLSLNPFDDNLLFLENDYGFLYRSTDTGTTFNLVDLLNQPAHSTSFLYDPDQLHIYRLFGNQTLRVSPNNGEPFSWQTKYSSDTEIFVSIDESISGTIYLADKKNIFISTDFGNNSSLFKTLDRKIIGIYKKPNSNKLYAASKYKIYEITSDTIQVIKSLPIPEETFSWFPLNLGNKWIYNNTFYGDLGDSIRWFSNSEVTGYKILENTVYNEVMVNETPIDPGGNSGMHYEYFRVDSVDGKIYKAEIENDSLLSEQLYMDLLAEVGDTIPVGNGIYLESEVLATVFGVDTRRRNFFSTQTPYEDIKLAKGFGLTFKLVWELIEIRNVLKGCIIDGIVYGDTTTVDVEDEEIPIATEFKLEQNYPNPFNPTTVISYRLPVSSNVRLKVYDVLGNEIATLVNAELSAGEYEVAFDGSKLTSGIYFYEFKTNLFIHSKKMILLK